MRSRVLLGLSAIGIAAAACGGNVVVDSPIETSTGGSAGTGGSGGTSTFGATPEAFCKSLCALAAGECGTFPGKCFPECLEQVDFLMPECFSALAAVYGCASADPSHVTTCNAAGFVPSLAPAPGTCQAELQVLGACEEVP